MLNFTVWDFKKREICVGVDVFSCTTDFFIMFKIGENKGKMVIILYNILRFILFKLPFLWDVFTVYFLKFGKKQTNIKLHKILHIYKKNREN